MANSFNDLASAALRAWATLARAWLEGATSVWFTVIDLAETESDEQGFNEAVVVVPAQAAPTALKLDRFADADDRQLSPAAIGVSPADLVAGEDTKVRISVTPPAGTASGTYSGSLWNSAKSKCLAEEIQLYVVGDQLP